MSDAFLRAIIENPEDDGPRLIYADWLDEHGQNDRAEFVRTQIEVAKIGEPHDRCKFGPVRNPRRLTSREAKRRERLREHADHLWDEHGGRWLAELPKLKGVSWDHPYRGFVEEVTVESYRAFRTHADHLFDLVPLRGVQFEDMKAASAVRLAEFPALSRLRYLTFHGSELGDRGATALARSPHAANLTSLEMSMSMVGDAGAEELAGSANLGHLRALMLYMNQITSYGAVALAQSDALPRLAVLILWMNNVREGGAAAWARTERFPELLFLSLHDQYAGGFRREEQEALRERWGDRLEL